MVVALAGRAIAVACALLATACKPDTDVPTPGSAVDAGNYYVDIVLAFADGTGQPPEVCADSLPACEEEHEPCGPTEVLGPPDGLTFSLGQGGLLDIGFRCAPVLERGGIDSPEIRIWSTVPPGESAVVLVSDDGETFQTWVELTASNQTLDLGRIDRMYTRYLRIADRVEGPGGIEIDSIEVLTDGSVEPPMSDAGAYDASPAFDAAGK